MSKWGPHSATSAEVNLAVDNNGSWSDAFQFGDPDDATWDLNGAAFECDVQRNPYDAAPLLHLSTDNGRIIVADAVQRVIYFDVAAADIQADLQPGAYVYDVVMINGTTAVRTPLMHGQLIVQQGVTYP